MSISASSRLVFLSTASVLRIHGPFDWSIASVGSSVDAGLLQRREPRLGQFLTGFGVDLAGLHVDQIHRDEAAEQIGAADQHFLGGLGDLADGAGGQLGVGIGHHLAGFGVDQRLQQLDAAERVGVERPRPALRRVGEHHLAVEVGQDFLGIHAADLAGLQRLALGLAGRAQLLGAALSSA